ncbi:histidine phosphatase family protein, partial [Lactobacillus sp. XV13L]|nr:histidine phosphatase family protein [Lactobacillus sp. XV13L]
CDSPLTHKGIIGASKIAQKLQNIGFDIACSSDLPRSVITCKAIIDSNINKNILNIRKIPDFREVFYGYFEGMPTTEAWSMILRPYNLNTFHEAIQRIGFDRMQNYLKKTDPFHEAENATEYWRRINNGFSYLDSIANENDKILLVTHGTVI